jgi:hypothetical protein
MDEPTPATETLFCEECAEKLKLLLANPTLKESLKNHKRATNQSYESILAAVHAYLAQFPDAGSRDIRANVSGKTSTVLQAIKQARMEIEENKAAATVAPLFKALTEGFGYERPVLVQPESLSRIGEAIKQGEWNPYDGIEEVERIESGDFDGSPLEVAAVPQPEPTPAKKRGRPRKVKPEAVKELEDDGIDMVALAAAWVFEHGIDG